MSLMGYHQQSSAIRECCNSCLYGIQAFPIKSRPPSPTWLCIRRGRWRCRQRRSKMCHQPAERRALRPGLLTQEGDGIYGSLGGAAVVWGQGRVGGPQGSVRRMMGLENSATRSQERRSCLGLRLSKMYIQANHSLGGYHR